MKKQQIFVCHKFYSQDKDGAYSFYTIKGDDGPVIRVEWDKELTKMILLPEIPEYRKFGKEILARFAFAKKNFDTRENWEEFLKENFIWEGEEGYV